MCRVGPGSDRIRYAGCGWSRRRSNGMTWRDVACGEVDPETPVGDGVSPPVLFSAHVGVDLHDDVRPDLRVRDRLGSELPEPCPSLNGGRYRPISPALFGSSTLISRGPADRRGVAPHVGAGIGRHLHMTERDGHGSSRSVAAGHLISKSGTSAASSRSVARLSPALARPNNSAWSLSAVDR